MILMNTHLATWERVSKSKLFIDVLTSKHPMYWNNKTMPLWLQLFNVIISRLIFMVYSAIPGKCQEYDK